MSMSTFASSSAPSTLPGSLDPHPADRRNYASAMPPNRSRPRALAVNAVQGTLRRMGYELQPYIKGIPVQPREEDFRRVKLLASHGVTVLLDVGANIGQWALRTRSAG